MAPWPLKELTIHVSTLFLIIQPAISHVTQMSLPTISFFWWNKYFIILPYRWRHPAPTPFHLLPFDDLTSPWLLMLFNSLSFHPCLPSNDSMWPLTRLAPPQYRVVYDPTPHWLLTQSKVQVSTPCAYDQYYVTHLSSILTIWVIQNSLA